VLEPYAMKVARTVLRRGKFERTNLFQLDTHVVHAVNYERSWLALHKAPPASNSPTEGNNKRRGGGLMYS